MAISELITSPEDARQRGDYPSIFKPLLTADGLLFRLPISGHVLTPVQVSKLSEILLPLGDARIGICSRGTLEISGLSPEMFTPDIRNAILATVDAEPAFFADHSPLLGLDASEAPATARLVAVLKERTAPLAARLGNTVHLIVDGKGAISLDGLDADVGVTAQNDDLWAVTIGGGKPQTVDFDTAVSTTLALLSALAALGPEARASDLFVPYSARTTSTEAPRLGRIGLRSGDMSFALRLPKDGVPVSALQNLAQAASADSIPALRLAPHSVLMIDNASDALIASARELGLV
ncbi:hypothetical protein [Devosia sp. MC521]|uniref:hypothetical protein n=1 Tax=Devosia sp. MC521 TaxID=2759954 RepID=UPI0015F799D1|nr:hypothetical protein [Devosia sp. MC521]MBJ6988121.1 hypothetical protein [Devosia sp. MC521]QMW63407.1 hypothetical protein H4N61_03450 [Devosia sp. MC521]